MISISIGISVLIHVFQRRAERQNAARRAARHAAQASAGVAPARCPNCLVFLGTTCMLLAQRSAAQRIKPWCCAHHCPLS